MPISPQLHNVFNQSPSQSGAVFDHSRDFNASHGDVAQVRREANLPISLRILLANLDEAPKRRQEFPGGSERLWQVLDTYLGWSMFYIPPQKEN
jgi:hypothetical protein